MFGFWLCLFNRGILAWGLCLLLCGGLCLLLCRGCVCYCVGVVSVIVWGLCLLLCGVCVMVIFVWLLKFNNVVWGEVWGWSLIRCWLCQFEIGALDKGLLDLSVSYYFVPHFGVSAFCLKCTEHVGCKSDVVQWRMYVGTEGGWAKGIGWEGVSGAVGKIVMTWRVV